MKRFYRQTLMQRVQTPAVIAHSKLLNDLPVDKAKKIIANNLTDIRAYIESNKRDK